MANMARHGSVGAYSGFSVCQPALGAALQWLPAVGTPELDDMINAFLPGPASIQDKRAHISMDFFEYSRQTGESFKFYPVPSASFTPVTASPVTSALYDSGYASSFNHSPVLSDQGSWTHSPAPFAQAASDTRTKSHSSASKKSSVSSSRQGTVDFATHPGMRILTKDGRDVTNSASRGCKTKEQRDHAHLMRIIKACDACRRKKIRCDPSHRKRNASQSSASQPEQKPAKKSRKAEESPSVAILDPAADLLAATAFDASEIALSFAPADADFHENYDEFWTDFVTFDQDPVAVAAASAYDDFLFDSFTDLQNFSPSSGSSSTSPSQTFTPFTSVRSGASPVAASDVAVDSAEFSFRDATVPYLNPGVAHGTNYVDFNLYSPGPEVFEEDPVFQLRDLASQQPSPQSQGSAAEGVAHNSPGASLTERGVHSPVSWATSTRDETRAEIQTAVTSPAEDPRQFVPGPSLEASDGSIGRLKTNHNRLVGGDTGGIPGPDLSSVSGGSSPVTPFESRDVSSSIVFASALQSSVSPGTPARPRRLVSAPARGSPASLVGLTVSTPTARAAITAAPCPSGLLPLAASRSSSVAGDAPRGVAGVDVANVRPPRHDQGRISSALFSSSQPVADHAPRLSAARIDVLHVVPQDNGAANAALTTTVFSTLPTRCNVAGGEGVLINNNTPLLQLAVLGLVSLLCALALQQAHLLASQAKLVNILAIISISLARLAPRCAGPLGATWFASKTLPPSSPSLPSALSGVAGSLGPSTVQIVAESLQALRCTVSRRVRSLAPRRPWARALRV